MASGILEEIALTEGRTREKRRKGAGRDHGSQKPELVKGAGGMKDGGGL